MGDLWNIIIINPLAFLLSGLYSIFSNYGVAIIMFTLLTKLILLPLSMKAKKGMMSTTRVQPKVQALQKQYANNKQKLQEEMAKLYQAEGVNPMGGCLWSLLPFPVLIALYTVIRTPVTNLMKITAEQIELIIEKVPAINAIKDAIVGPGGVDEMQLAQHITNNFDAVRGTLGDAGSSIMKIDFSFLGLNLAEQPTPALNALILIPILAGVAAYFGQWAAQKFSGATSPPSGGMILKLMPLLSVWFCFMMPAGMGVYWIASSGFGIVQDYFLSKHYNRLHAEDVAAKEALEDRRREAEQALKEEARLKREENMMIQKQNSKSRRPRGGKGSNRPRAQQQKKTPPPDAKQSEEEEVEEDKPDEQEE